MARYKEINDLYFTDSGDFFVGDDGDIEDTKDFHLRGFAQKIFTRLYSTPGDWAIQPRLGAALDRFVGKPNSASIADEIKGLIWSQITQDDLVRFNEGFVDIVPIGQNRIAIFIILSNIPGTLGATTLTFTYDMRDNRLVPRSVSEVI